MIPNQFDLVLRTIQQNYIKTDIRVRQNDVLVNIINIRITDGVNEIDYSQVASPKIVFAKPDKTVVQGHLEINPSGGYIYIMGTNEIAVTGIILACVLLYGANGERLTTSNFQFEVVKDLLTPGVVESSTQFDELTRLITEAQELIDSSTASQLQNQIDNVNDAIAELNIDLSTPSYTTPTTTQDNIISLPSTANAQLQMELDGNTYTNLLGSDGDCEDISKWSSFQATRELDQSNRVFGSNGFKVTTTSGAAGSIYKTPTSPSGAEFLFNPSKYYLVSAYLKNGNTTNILIRKEAQGGGSVITSDVITATSFVRTGFKLQPSQIHQDNAIVVRITGDVGTFGFVDGIMINEITQQDHDTLTTDQLLVKYPYINNTKGTGAQRVKSVGKNLLPTYNDITKYLNTTALTIDGRDLNLSTSTPINRGIVIKIKKNTVYTISGRVKSNGGADGGLSLRQNDNTISIATLYGYKPNLDFIPVSTTFNSGNNNTIHIFTWAGNGTGIITLQDVQLEEGTTATPYQPYTETLTYTPPILHRLPNGVSDSFDIVTGKKVQNNSEININNINASSMNTSNSNVDYLVISLPLDALNVPQLDNNKLIVETIDSSILPVNDVGNIGKWKYWSTSQRQIAIGFSKGTSLEIARNTVVGKTIIYQLANPVTTYYPTRYIKAEPNGTIYVDPAIEDYGFYNGGITVTTPMQSLSEVLLFDKETGAYEDITSTCMVASNKLSFTTTRAINGDLLSFAYEYPSELSTNSMKKHSYGTNIKADVEDSKNAIVKVSKDIDIVRQSSIAHMAENITQGGNPHGLIYESGLWTPTIAGSVDNGDFVPVYGSTYGRYVRNGKLVTIQFVVTLNSKSGNFNGGMRIKGLPFTPLDSIAGVTLATVVNFSYSANVLELALRILSDGIAINQIVSGSNFIGTSASNLLDNFQILGSATYQIS